MSNATEFDRSRDGEWGCRPEVIIGEMRRCGTDCENVWNNKNDEIRGLFGTHGVIPHHSLDTFVWRRSTRPSRADDDAEKDKVEAKGVLRTVRDPNDVRVMSTVLT